MKFIGVKLRSLREAKGLSQEGLAERAGVSVGSVKNAESEKTRPHEETVSKISKALGVHWTFFYDLDGQKNVHSAKVQAHA